MLVYNVHINLTITDDLLLDKKGKSNYFCAKAIHEICNNDYNETRNQRMVPVVEAYQILIDFREKYKNCDLSRWGTIHLFETIIKVKYGEDYLASIDDQVNSLELKDELQDVVDKNESESSGKNYNCTMC